MKPQFLSHLLILGAIFFVSILIAGCGAIAYVSPKGGTSVNSPVNVEITWGAIQGIPTIFLDNMDVTSLFTIDSANGRATATLTMLPGSHTFRTSGNMYCGYCTGNKYPVSTYSITFTVQAPSIPPVPPATTATLRIVLAPRTLLIERGKSAALSITATRTNFTGGVTVTTSQLPSGITVSPLTIPGAASSGTLTFSANSTAAFGSKSITIRSAGPGGTPVQTNTLMLTVGRAVGAFTEITPSSNTVITSPDGRRSATISLKSSIPLRYEATYKLGTASLGNPIEFGIGPTSSLGGAGFCAGSAAGAVLSGDAQSMGSSTDHVFTFIYFDNPFARHQIPVASMKAISTSPPAFHTYLPRVAFSPDCSLALVAGAAQSGTTTSNELTVIDLVSGKQICFKSFNETFSARVLATNNSEVVEVTTDSTTSTCPIL